MSRTTRAGVKLPRRPIPPPTKVHTPKAHPRKVKHKKPTIDEMYDNLPSNRFAGL